MNAPILQAFLLADKVFRELETGKVHIAGTFNQIGSRKFPFVHPQFSVYVSLTDVKAGKHEVELEIRHVESQKTLLEVKQVVESRGPLEVIEMNYTFNGVTFEQEGPVDVVLIFKGEVIGARSLKVTKAPNQKARPF